MLKDIDCKIMSGNILGKFMCNHLYIDMKDSIIDKCKEKYPFSFKCKKNIKKYTNDTYDSGLLILSKYPITEKQEHLYNETIDISSKSYLLCKIMDINIINTHLIPSNYNIVNENQVDKYLDNLRFSQISDISLLIKKLDNVLLCGDFNVEYQNELDFYNKMITTLELIDCHNYNNKQICTYNDFSNDITKYLTLDYILNKNLKTNNFTIQEIYTSDHFPVTIECELYTKDDKQKEKPKAEL